MTDTFRQATEQAMRAIEAALSELRYRLVEPIDMVLHCPSCGKQHIDKDNSEEVHIAAAERGFDHGSRDWEAYIEHYEWTNPPHRSHLCLFCDYVWRPADAPTNGVEALKTREILERIGPIRQLQAGYDRPVFVHQIVARDTVDEDVLANRGIIGQSHLKGSSHAHQEDTTPDDSSPAQSS